jgi:plasmid stabilization system protein ParE
MAGENMSYKLVYTASFHTSLENLIRQWADYEISDATIERYVQKIFLAISSLKTFPNRYHDVSELYDLETPARRIIIGSRYTIFYRVFPNQETILVGKIFNFKQGNIEF